jgi:type IV secretory pathway VirB10-like protein
MAIENPNHTAPINLDDDAGELAQQAAPVVVPETPPAPPPAEPTAANKRLEEFATRANLTGKEGMDTKKLVLLGGGLIAAVLFFLFTQFQTHPVRKAKPAEQKKQQPDALTQPQQPASKTPIMEPVTVTNSDQDGGKVSASDIARTRKPDYNRPSSGSHDVTPPQYAAGGGRSLGDVPSFSDTQQKFEDPSPYKGGSSSAPGAASQEASAMKEASLVYVRAPEQGLTGKHADHGEELPVLQLKEGTRVEARLETQISSDIHAPVVAVVENTYAVGDQVLVPAGARLFGRMAQAHAQGEVGVDFDEIDLLDGSRQKIAAIGLSEDMGPIKGNVYGKHNGRNFLIRAMSGMGSTAAMLVGNNVNGAFSEGDMMRERASDNIGMAADTQLMQMNANTHISVSVPANTKIYVVWTQHEKGTGLSTAANAVATP